MQGKVKITFPCDPTQGVRYSALKQQLCAITIFGIASCETVTPEKVIRTTAQTGSFLRELVFTGYIDQKLRVTYREFIDSTRRPILVVETEQPMETLPALFEYKGARLEVVGITPRRITYQVLEGFAPL
jgi:hypothetical protein